MIGAGISYYAQASGENYRSGNAKIYDGSFDYDEGAVWSRLNTNTPFSMLFDFVPQVGFASGLLWSQDNMIATSRAIYVQILGGGAVRFTISNGGSGSWLIIDTISTIALNAVTNIIITYDAGLIAAGAKIYFNGILQSTNVVGNTLSGTIAQASTTFSIGELNGLGFSGSKFTGKIRQLEILNRVASTGEISSAGSSGSFQAASVPLSDYLLAVEFNKTGTANLTTRTGTPTYAITAFGGAAYTPYL